MARFFPLLAVLIWAANTVVSKAAANVLDPAAISFYRWLVALLVLSPFMWRPLRAQWPAIRPLLPRFAHWRCWAWWPTSAWPTTLPT